MLKGLCHGVRRCSKILLSQMGFVTFFYHSGMVLLSCFSLQNMSYMTMFHFGPVYGHQWAITNSTSQVKQLKWLKYGEFH